MNQSDNEEYKLEILIRYSLDQQLHQKVSVGDSDLFSRIDQNKIKDT